MEQNLKKILLDKEFQYHRISSLIAAMITSFTFLVTTLVPFICNISPEKYHIIIKIIIILSVEAIIVIHWYRYRSVFPKSKGKQNIVIAIITENQKQKKRISQDFVNNLKEQLIKYQLYDSYNVLVLHNALTVR